MVSWSWQWALRGSAIERDRTITRDKVTALYSSSVAANIFMPLKHRNSYRRTRVGPCMYLCLTSGLRLIQTDRSEPRLADTYPTNWRGHGGLRRFDPTVFSTQSRVRQRTCPCSERRVWHWWICGGSFPGATPVLAPATDRPRAISVMFSYQGRAWEQGPVIGCNWAKLPLISWIERRGLCPKKRSSPFWRTVPPFLPIPAQALSNQSQMKAFLWGLGAAAAPLTKPDQKKEKRKKKEKLKAVECSNDSLTSLPLSEFTEKSFVVWVWRTETCF